MLLKHFFTGQIAHSSYILAGSETCAVVDPQRDVDLYIEAAEELGVRITHILETHLHADFVSGHMDLAKQTGAQIYVAKSAGCEFDHIAVSAGDSIWVEDMRLDVWETPGHTPEHLCYVVTDTARGDSPIGVFAGDLLFVGDVGRPDLFPEQAGQLAHSLYHSLHDQLLQLPDYCEVYPAHGSGSLCGRSMAAKWLSTIGYERKYNAALQITDEETFVSSLTSDMPPAPDHFARCSEINRQGPALVSEMPRLKGMAPLQFKERLESRDTILVDVRGYAAFAGLHIPGAWHIDLAGNFPIFSGWVLPPDKDILLVADNRQGATEAAAWARRVGLDRIAGYLKGGIAAWTAAGEPTASIQLLSARELHEAVMGALGDVALIDVRAPAEFESGHIEGALGIPAPDLRHRHTELSPETPTIVMCSAGIRSSLAASILRQHGFTRIQMAAGGLTGYYAAGYV
jgi:hydroxyacylglutathione hydrolase